MTDPVLVDCDGDIAAVPLNRFDKFNALPSALIESLANSHHHTLEVPDKTAVTEQILRVISNYALAIK